MFIHWVGAIPVCTTRIKIIPFTHTLMRALCVHAFVHINVVSHRLVNLLIFKCTYINIHWGIGTASEEVEGHAVITLETPLVNPLAGRRPLVVRLAAPHPNAFLVYTTNPRAPVDDLSCTDLLAQYLDWQVRPG